MFAMTLQTALIVNILMGFINCDKILLLGSTQTPKPCSFNSITTSIGCVEKYDNNCYANGGMKVVDLCITINIKPYVEPMTSILSDQVIPEDAFVHPKTPYNKTSDNGFKPLTATENYYVRSVCGQATRIRTRIINGKIPAKGQIPWAVSLQNGCSGVLISPRHVLTALHCVAKDGYNDTWNECPKNEVVVNKKVYYGGICSRKGYDCPQGRDMKVATVTRVIYPNNHAEGNKLYECLLQNDIAIVLLDEDIEFNDYVKPICVGPMHPDILTNLIDVGFGVKGLGLHDVSQLRYMESKIDEVLSDYLEIMTRGTKNTSTCPGDSGGPLQASFNGSSRTYLAGIHSLGKCVGWWARSHSSYVPVYADWICRLTGLCEPKNIFD